MKYFAMFSDDGVIWSVGKGKTKKQAVRKGLKALEDTFSGERNFSPAPCSKEAYDLLRKKGWVPDDLYFGEDYEGYFVDIAEEATI